MRRRRQLTGEEKSLWAGVARTAVPLPGRKIDDAEPASSETQSAAPPKAGASPKAAARPAPAPPAAPVPPVSPRPETPRHPMPSYVPPVSKARPALFHPIEKPVKRKLAAGRVAIEDRIDLHDKSQVVAHYALLLFLRQAQAAGMRHVLVITGRGASFGSSGVIRRSLPHWFHTAEFRGLVAGFEPADRVHGGEGAFYVRVRRR